MLVWVPNCFSHVWLFVTLWTVAHQAPLSVGFSRQEDWSGLPFPPPGELLDPGIKPEWLALQADSLPSEPPGKLRRPYRPLLWVCGLLSSSLILWCWKQALRFWEDQNFHEPLPIVFCCDNQQLKTWRLGPSPTGAWLRIQLAMQRTWAGSLAGEPRSHVPQ